MSTTVGFGVSTILARFQSPSQSIGSEDADFVRTRSRYRRWMDQLWTCAVTSSGKMWIWSRWGEYVDLNHKSWSPFRGMDVNGDDWVSVLLVSRWRSCLSIHKKQMKDSKPIFEELVMSWWSRCVEQVSYRDGKLNLIWWCLSMSWFKSLGFVVTWMDVKGSSTFKLAHPWIYIAMYLPFLNVKLDHELISYQIKFPLALPHRCQMKMTLPSNVHHTVQTPRLECLQLGS